MRRRERGHCGHAERPWTAAAGAELRMPRQVVPEALGCRLGLGEHAHAVRQMVLEPRLDDRIVRGPEQPHDPGAGQVDDLLGGLFAIGYVRVATEIDEGLFRIPPHQRLEQGQPAGPGIEHPNRMLPLTTRPVEGLTQQQRPPAKAPREPSIGATLNAALMGLESIDCKQPSGSNRALRSVRAGARRSRIAGTAP